MLIGENIIQRTMIEQLIAIVPYGPTIFSKAEETIEYSRQKAAATCTVSLQKYENGKKRCLDFKKESDQCFNSIIKETTDECLTRIEKLVGVDTGSESKTTQLVRERIQAIYQTILRDYVLKYSSLVRQKSLARMQTGKQFCLEYTLPLYIHIKAVLIVSKEMLLQFLDNHMNGVKMTYESSKDIVTMFIKGKYNEDKIRAKFKEGIDNFKQLTVEIASKGLKIKIDRKTLMEDYDRFAVQFLSITKQMREKSEDNLGSMKKKSRALYQEVIERIKEKQLEIRCEMKELVPFEEYGKQTKQLNSSSTPSC